MKKILSVVLVLVAAFACANAAVAYQSPVKATGFVNDFAGIFSTEQKSTLEQKIAGFYQLNGSEISVLTVSSLGDETVETYAVKLFAEWGIGKKKTDNGLLILVAPTEQKMRIEVGYGLEGTVTDAQASVIIRTVMTPAFKENRYFDGVSGAVDQIIGLISGDPTVVPTGSSDSFSSQDIKNYETLIVFGLIVIGNLAAFMARSKSWWLGGVVGLVAGLIFLGIIGALISALLGLIIDFLLSRYGGDWFKSHRGTGGFWFPGGGRGGGGFGGFGGGRSGGGGSSGGW